jgi:hypothetical protein
VYDKNQLEDISGLTLCLCAGLATVKVEMLQSVHIEMILCAEACVTANGSNSEQLL